MALCGGRSDCHLGGTAALLCACLLQVGCSFSPDADRPRTLTHVFEPVAEFRSSELPLDLDGDGIDEIVDYDPNYRRWPRWQPVLVWTQSRVLLDQINVGGTPLPPAALDLDDDGMPELLVPYMRDDSLFVTVCDSRAQKLYGMFLISGAPIEEPDEPAPFIVGNLDFHVVDVDGDGTKELVSVVSSRRKRGILVSRLPTGEQIDFLQIGAHPEYQHLYDTDGDGVEELVVSSLAVNNGAVGSGMDDRHSYVAAIKLTPPVRPIWIHETGGLWSRTVSVVKESGGGSEDEIIAATTATRASSESQPAMIEYLNPVTGEPLRRRAISEPIRWFVVSDLDHNLKTEIIGLREPNVISVFDAELQPVLQRELAGDYSSMHTTPDLNGDGLQEIILHSRQRSEFVLVGADLGVRAVVKGESILGIIQRGLGRQPLLLVRRGEGNVAVELVRNPFALVYRYGPALGTLALLLLIGWTVVRITKRRRRTAINSALADLAVDSDQRPIAVFDTAERLIEANGAFYDLVNGSNSGNLSALPAGEKPFKEFCRRAIGEGAPVAEERVRIGKANDEYRLTSLPVSAGILSNGLRIVIAEPTDENTFGSKAWGIVARRVAHDMKSPLNSILLYAQHLRVNAARVEDRDLAERIEERVEHLRRLARNFLKIVDLEEPVRVVSDVNRIVRDHLKRLTQDVPPDITVKMDCESPLPPIGCDPEQIVSVLENLTANAIEALSGGGSIKVATSLARSLRTHNSGSATDHVVIEVSDTGAGVPEDLVERIFETGFSTRREGSGLGLAIARKIVEDHGGRIEVTTRMDVGTVFSVFLPALEAKG